MGHDLSDPPLPVSLYKLYLFLDKILYKFKQQNINKKEDFMLPLNAEKRLYSKTDQHRLVTHLQKNYGLPFVASEVLAKDIINLTQQNPYNITAGQILHTTVKATEPAGKKLSECEKVNVILTIYDPDEDLNVKDSFQLKKVRIHRISNEAYRQNGLLTIEEIAMLLTTSISTVKRCITSLRGEGKFVPTRGYQLDIGRGSSHKVLTIKYFLNGFQPTKIARILHHCLDSIERYIKDFYKVYISLKEGIGKEKITRVSGITGKVVKEYIDIIENVGGIEKIDDDIIAYMTKNYKDEGGEKNDR